MRNYAARVPRDTTAQQVENDAQGVVVYHYKIIFKKKIIKKR